MASKLTAIKEISSILAAICVAGWAVYTTWANNEELIADLKVKELQLNTLRGSLLNSEMTVETFNDDQIGSLIEVRILFENKGNYVTRVLLEEKSLSISKIMATDSETKFLGTRYFGDSRFKGTEMKIGDYIDISGGQNFEVKYLTRVNESGLYLVRSLFKRKLYGDDLKKFGNYGAGKPPNPDFKYKAVGSDEIIYIEN